MNSKKIIQHSQKSLGTAVASSVLAAALMSAPMVASAGSSSERCADIVKGGKNTCAVKSLGISCQGNATEDNMAGAWIKVPAGTCANIVSICAGDAEAPEGTKEKKLAKACGKIAEQEEGVVGGRLVDKFGESIEVAADDMMDKAEDMKDKAEDMMDKADDMQEKADDMMDKAEDLKEKAKDMTSDQG